MFSELLPGSENNANVVVNLFSAFAAWLPGTHHPLLPQPPPAEQLPWTMTQTMIFTFFIFVTPTSPVSLSNWKQAEGLQASRHVFEGICCGAK